MAPLRSILVAAATAFLIACSGGSATGPQLPVGPLLDVELSCDPVPCVKPSSAVPTAQRAGTVTVTAMGRFLRLDGVEVVRPLNMKWYGL